MRRRPSNLPIFVRVAAVACVLGAAFIPHGSAGERRGTARCPDAPAFTCSTLTVPLDHSGHVPGTLALRIAAQDADAPRGVLIFLSGGPGQPGEPFAYRVASRLGPATAGFRIVMLDQRGTGAGALRCRALQRQMGTSDLAVPSRAAGRACAAAVGPQR